MERTDDFDCMTFIAGKDASATGRVLIGHNEDNNGTFSIRRGYVPAADWPEGTVLPAEPGCAAIPQVSHTYGYYWTQFKKFSGGVSNSDAFINERGVCIVSNSMGTTKEPESDNDILLTEGGIYYNLRRCLAERASSAREGAEILMELVGKYGYASSGRAYTIADKDEAFQFQLVRGKRYMGARIPDDAIVVMPNHLTFRTLHDCPEMFYPDDIVEYAVSRGWYKPKHKGDYSDFDFAAAYQARSSRFGHYNVSRQRQGQHMLLGMNPFSADFGFCHTYARKVGVSDFAAALSSHSESIFRGQVGFGPGLSPHELNDNYPICRSTTLESDIIEFGTSPEDTILHASFGRPCEVPFISFLPLRKLPEQLCAVADPTGAMANHFAPDTSVGTAEGGIPGKMAINETLADLTYSRSMIFLGSYVRQNHENLDGIRNRINELKADNGKFFDEVYAGMTDALNMTLRRIDITVLPIKKKDGAVLPDTIRIRFRFAGDIDPYSLVIGTGRRSVRKFCSPLLTPDSLKRTGKTVYTAEFGTAELAETVMGHGRFNLFVAGCTTDGSPFAGNTEIVF